MKHNWTNVFISKSKKTVRWRLNYYFLEWRASLPLWLLLFPLQLSMLNLSLCPQLPQQELMSPSFGSMVWTATMLLIRLSQLKSRPKALLKAREFGSVYLISFLMLLNQSLSIITSATLSKNLKRRDSQVKTSSWLAILLVVLWHKSTRSQTLTPLRHKCWWALSLQETRDQSMLMVHLITITKCPHSQLVEPRTVLCVSPV